MVKKYFVHGVAIVYKQAYLICKVGADEQMRRVEMTGRIGRGRALW
jgi:hypothetical protein